MAGKFRQELLQMLDSAVSMLPMSMVSIPEVINALAAIGGVKFCSRCGGSGRVTYSALHGHDFCFKCGGNGVKRNKLTPSEIGELINTRPEKLFNKLNLQFKSAELKAEKLAEKARLLEEAKELTRQECIAHLTPETRLAFITIMNGCEILNAVTNETSVSYVSDFIMDLANQFKRKGYLSEKQIQCVLNQIEKQKAKEEQKKSFVQYVCGERATVTGHVQSIKEVECVQFNYYASSTTNKVILKTSTGQFMVVKTNAARLLDVFQKALDENTEVEMNGVVSWISPEQNPVCFTSRGMKVRQV